MRRLCWLIAVAVAVPGAVAQAAPRACAPLVVDDRGDADSLAPVPRDDLDVVSADLATPRDAKTLTITVRTASMPAQPVTPGTYDVFFKAGQRSYLASAYRGADGERFRLESDAPAANGVADVRDVEGAFDAAKATARFDIPMAALGDGKRLLRRGDKLFGIAVVTAEAYGIAQGYAGLTVDSTTQDNIYKIGAAGCAGR